MVRARVVKEVLTMAVFFQTFIDIEKWDLAMWRATAFLRDPEGINAPVLGIVFTDIAAGREIFENWTKRLGNVDQHEELRISIVEGEILGEGPGYSVHISSDPSRLMDAGEAGSPGHNTDIQTAVVI